MIRFIGGHLYIWDIVGGILHSMLVGAILFIGLGTVLTIIPIGTDRIITIIGIVTIIITMFAISTATIIIPTSTGVCPPERVT